MLRWLSFPTQIFTTLAEKGLVYCISFSVTYLYLKFLDLIWKKRFDLYDLLSERGDKNGFFVPDIEWQLDTPQDNRTLGQNCDDVFCFGVNSKGEALAIHVARQPNGKVRCSLLLQLANGERFTLPEGHRFQSESSEEYTFGSSRLKLQCLRPMRTWRVFFNGLLKKQQTNENSPCYRHVSFTFIFTASSENFDFSRDMSKTMIAKNSSAKFSWKFSPIYIAQKIREIFNSYEQSGMLMGTLKFEGEEEKEILLWGSKGRYMGKTKSFKNSEFVDIYGTFENGAIVHLGILQVPGIAYKFFYGYVMRSDGFMHPLENVEEGSVDSPEGCHKYIFHCGDVNYTLGVNDSKYGAVTFPKEFCETSTSHYVTMTLNEFSGRGFVFNGHCRDDQKKPKTEEILQMNSYNETINDLLTPSQKDKAFPLAVSFDEDLCQNGMIYV